MALFALVNCFFHLAHSSETPYLLFYTKTSELKQYEEQLKLVKVPLDLQEEIGTQHYFTFVLSNLEFIMFLGVNLQDEIESEIESHIKKMDERNEAEAMQRQFDEVYYVLLSFLLILTILHLFHLFDNNVWI